MVNQSGENIFGLLVTSELLLEKRIFQYIQNYFIDKETGWIQQNVVLVMKTIFNLPNYEKLQRHCIASFCKDPLPTFSSNDFWSLDKDMFFSLFKRDDLKIEEIIIWDSLIKWGINQIPELKNINNNRDKWTNENYEDLKNTLKNFIPLIRFYNISPDDFYDKVRPYERIIPNNLYEKIIEYYLVEQPKFLNHESEIIKPRLATILVNWIDRFDSKVLSFNNKYKFNLIYKKSQDGFDCTIFNNKCNGQGPFVVLVKVQSKKIYGGYNPIGYNGRHQWLSSSESFTFSFENERDILNMKIGRVINVNQAIQENCNWFFFDFGWHLAIYKSDQNLYLNNNGYYDNTFDLDLYKHVYLPIEEIEVFSVVKNNSYIELLNQ